MMRRGVAPSPPSLSLEGEGAGRAALCHSERRLRPCGATTMFAKESGAGRTFGLADSPLRRGLGNSRFLASLGMTGAAARRENAKQPRRECSRDLQVARSGEVEA